MFFLSYFFLSFFRTYVSKPVAPMTMTFQIILIFVIIAKTEFSLFRFVVVSLIVVVVVVVVAVVVAAVLWLLLLLLSFFFFFFFFCVFFFTVYECPLRGKSSCVRCLKGRSAKRSVGLGLPFLPDHEAFKLGLNLDGRLLHCRVVEVDVNGRLWRIVFLLAGVHVGRFLVQ